MWTHYIAGWWWHPLALCDEVTIANVITGTTHHHKTEPGPTADTMVWPLGTEWPQITRIPSLLTPAWSCVTSTRTHAHITAWVCVLCTAGFLLCVKTRNVLPRTMNQVLYEGKSFFSFPDNRIERRDGKLLWKFHHILNFRVDCYCGVNTGCLIYQILWKILMMMQLNKHYDQLCLLRRRSPDIDEWEKIFTIFSMNKYLFRNSDIGDK